MRWIKIDVKFFAEIPFLNPISPKIVRNHAYLKSMVSAVSTAKCFVFKFITLFRFFLGNSKLRGTSNKTKTKYPIFSKSILTSLIKFF